MIKEHKKEQSLYNLNRKKERKHFFHPEKNPLITFSSTEKKRTRDQKRGRNDVTQVTA